MKHPHIVLFTEELGLESHEVTPENLIPWCEARGFYYIGDHTNARQRDELQGQPKFIGLCGPMWNCDGIRYESQPAYNQLSV